VVCALESTSAPTKELNHPYLAIELLTVPDSTVVTDNLLHSNGRLSALPRRFVGASMLSLHVIPTTPADHVSNVHARDQLPRDSHSCRLLAGIGASGTGGSYDIRPTINPSVPGPPEGSAFSLAVFATTLGD
jgi:hypothetical protein